MKRILAVEDESNIRDNLQQILELSNFEAIVAQDGVEGLQLAIETQPDLIISDIRMPNLDGYGLLAALRGHADTRSIPVIFLTAKADRPDLRKGMELGADDYLTKPFTPEELLNAVYARLSRKDLTELQQQEEIEDLCTRLSRALPHELNTPLNAILGMTDLMIQQQGKLTPQESLEMLQTVHTSAQRLYRLIQNSLLYADLELKAKQPKAAHPFQGGRGDAVLLNLCLKALGTDKAKAYDRLADLNFDVPPLKVGAPEPQLYKIFRELLDNAFKFSKTGTPIDIFAQAHGPMVQVYIKDQGRGMTAAQIASVRAYTQFDRKLYEQQGCGLGLAIASRMVELLGGELKITSLPGEHTTVCITLPQYNAEEGNK